MEDEVKDGGAAFPETAWVEALADRLEAHTEQMANTSWGLTMQEWNVISHDILKAAITLRLLSARKED